MVRVILLILLIAGAGVLAFNSVKEKIKHDLSQPVAVSSTSPAPDQHEVKRRPATGSDTTSVYVPYWTLRSLDGETYDEYIYFGITPGKNGIDRSEAGSTQLDTFVSSVPARTKKHLAIRMINSDQNFAILKDQGRQKQIIAQTLTIADENNFDGVVLDLELSAIPFESIVSQINRFVTDFNAESEKNGKTFAMTLYGDTFYRLRPFDVKTLAQHGDDFQIMAYDFHKARGSKPGPNFPLHGKETYGYDMATMSEDFLKHIPADKITVIFGLFGYDWEVDVNGTATSQGKPLTYNEISSKFLSGCPYSDCSIQRDTASGETKITYTDEANTKHVVWFEDMESVEAKQNLLRQKGINSFSFWAHSYF